MLSLATKSSYKDKKTGEYNSHTEWHRCIVWGRLAEFAEDPRRARICPSKASCVSRERRQEDQTPSSAIWEVRVTSILKLDRAEKVGPEEQEHDEINPEEEAA